MQTFLLIVLWALTGFTYFACYKFGYYSGRLAEFKDTSKWLDGMLERAEKREAAKNRVSVTAPPPKAQKNA